MKTEYSEVFQIVYLGYWETYDARQWDIIEGITDKSLRVRCEVNMPIGAKLRLRVFRILGHDFDKFQALVKITEKAPCREGGLEGYEYELEFIEISEENRLKLGCSITTHGKERKSILARA